MTERSGVWRRCDGSVTGQNMVHDNCPLRKSNISHTSSVLLRLEEECWNACVLGIDVSVPREQDTQDANALDASKDAATAASNSFLLFLVQFVVTYGLIVFAVLLCFRIYM